MQSDKNMYACRKSAQFDLIGPHMAPFGPFGHVWPCLTLFGTIMPHLATFGPAWPHLALLGHSSILVSRDFNVPIRQGVGPSLVE